MNEQAKYCWLFHKWTFWTRVGEKIVLPQKNGPPMFGTAPYQQRFCLRCGKIQQEAL